jgi:hypothetical protein
MGLEDPGGLRIEGSRKKVWRGDDDRGLQADLIEGVGDLYPHQSSSGHQSILALFHHFPHHFRIAQGAQKISPPGPISHSVERSWKTPRSNKELVIGDLFLIVKMEPLIFEIDLDDFHSLEKMNPFLLVKEVRREREIGAAHFTGQVLGDEGP